jgi:hypothetical protein
MSSTYSYVILTIGVGVEEVPSTYRLGATAIARSTRRLITATFKPLKQPNSLNFKASSDSLPQHRRITISAPRQRSVQGTSLAMPITPPRTTYII